MTQSEQLQYALMIQRGMVKQAGPGNALRAGAGWLGKMIGHGENAAGHIGEAAGHVGEFLTKPRSTGAWNALQEGRAVAKGRMPGPVGPHYPQGPHLPPGVTPTPAGSRNYFGPELPEGPRMHPDFTPTPAQPEMGPHMPQGPFMPHGVTPTPAQPGMGPHMPQGPVIPPGASTKPTAQGFWANNLNWAKNKWNNASNLQRGGALYGTALAASAPSTYANNAQAEWQQEHPVMSWLGQTFGGMEKKHDRSYLLPGMFQR